MSRIYAVPYTGTLTNTGGNADLFEITPAAEKPIRLVGLVLSQSSEVQDAAEEALSISIIRLPDTVTSSNGTAVTPVPLNDLDTAASFAAEANGATVATTTGSATTVEEFAWNIRMSPLERWWPDPDTRITYRRTAGTARALLVRCNTTVTDDISISITAYVEELG